MGVHQRPPMCGPADWGMSRSGGSPVAGPGHPGASRSGPMGGPVMSRSISAPDSMRSMLQQQLLDMGTSEDGLGMSPFGGHGPPPQSPSWTDSAMGVDRAPTSMSRERLGHPLEELLGPLGGGGDGHSEERALLDQLDSLLNTADVIALQEIDRALGIPEIAGQAQGPEGHQQCQDPGQGPPSEPFPGLDSSLGMEQNPVFGQGYPGPPGPPSMGVQPSYGGMQSQAPGGFSPMMNQMGQTGGFPGMGGMGNPRGGNMRPRVMATNKPLRMQLQQRLQGQQFMNQTRQGLKMENAPRGNLGMRPGAQPGMAGQGGLVNSQMMAQRSREMLSLQMKRQRMMMLMQQQQQAAAGGFSPPPNVTAPGGLDGPMGGPPMSQPGQQGFGYGGMNQQGDATFMAAGSTPPGHMVPGRMGGPPQGAMMASGMQGGPQGGHMFPSGDMKGWPQAGLPRSSPYSQQQFPPQAGQAQFGPMMMGGPGPAGSSGGGQMAPVQGQMGMNSMGMGRMPM